MKVRIKFSKTGPLKYIGHLDIMRYFQKLNRRANIPVAYSEGFSPHQILSFSPPLSLGAESLGEYADLEITELINSDEAISELNKHSVDGIEIYSFKQLPEKSPNAMSCVTAARYLCSLKDTISVPFDVNEELANLFLLKEINVVKKTKKNETTINIRPLVYAYSFPNNEKAEFLLSAGSIDNLKPELIYKVIFDKYNIEMPDRPLDIIRIDMYTGEKDNLVSLNDIGMDIKCVK